MTEREETVAWRKLWAALWSHHAAICTRVNHDCMAHAERRADELYQEIAAEVRGA